MKRFLFILIATMCIGSTIFAQTQKGLDIDGEFGFDRSGKSVSMPDSNTVAIGAYANDGNGSAAGHVRVYTWNGSAWTQKGVDIDGEAALNQSGYSVSMPDSNTVAIGAPNNDENGTNAGHVRIYQWNGISWVQKGLDIDGEAPLNQSGWSVSMPDANTVAIGARSNDGNGSNAGHVRIYNWNGSAWTQKGVDIDGEAAGDRLGWSVSMPDSNTVAIGAPYNDGTGNDAGHVRIYNWNGSAWTQKGGDIDAEVAEDRSGWSVSMPDSNTVAIGAPYNDGTGIDAGHVRIYNWNGSAWIQNGVDIDGEAAADYSGFSVSMPDSNTVAIGAIGNTGTGIDAGHVRIYNWNGSAWTQNGVDIDGESVSDESGTSVSMPDASTVAIGAIGSDENDDYTGHVRVYTLCTYNTGTDVQTACNSYTWIDGNTYTASNNSATHALVNAAGCDSIVTLDLTINFPTSGTDVQTACGSYTWIDGNTYSASTNSPTYNATSVLTGCDSIVTLDLTIISPLTGVDVQTSCGNFTWIDGHTYASSTNSPTFTISNGAANGCDSIITLDLTITSPSTGVDVQTSCGNFTWIDGNTYASSTNSPIYTISNGATNGCDSVVTLDLTITSPSTGVDVQTSCGNFTWIDGNTYGSSTNSPTYTISNGAANGCDSIVTLNLTITSPSSGVDVQTSCGSFTWIDGNTYGSSTNSPTYTISNGAANGCDSIVTLNLTITSPSSGVDVQTSCGNFTWIDGNIYASSTNTPTYTIVGGGANGCDSILTLNLTILNESYGTDVQTACGSFTWMDGNTYYTNNNSATYVINGGAANGCDSIVTLNLTVNPMPNTDIDDQGITLVSQDASALYQWLDCNNDFAEISGETSMSYTPDTTGSYAVKLDLAGCVDTSVCFFVDYSDLEEVSDIDFKLYPNPTNELFTVEFADAQGKVEFKLLSTTGQLIERRTEQNFSSVQFKIASEPGVYFLEITFEDEQKAVLPIIKQ